MPFGEDLNVGVGNRTGDAGLKYSMPGDSVRQKFTGYQKDNETQLDFAEARMYENRFGRFTAVDPLLASGKSANPQSFNRFVYVTNSPLALTDPTGLDPWWKRQVKNSKRYEYAESKIAPDGKGWQEVTFNEEGFTTVAKFGTTNRTAYLYAGGGWDWGRKAAHGTPVSFETEAIQSLATGTTDGWFTGWTGIGKGVVNSPVVFLNGLTSCLLNCHVAGQMYFQGRNPFAAPNIIEYNDNALERSYGSGASIGTIGGATLAFGTIFGGSATPSVVPETVPFRFPPIKPGSVGGTTAGNRYVTVDVRREAAAENPENYCVYCRQQFPTLQNEHAIPFSRGGNSTIENIQRACSFCNQSKGARDFPVNPAPGYEGPFPPPWWNQ